jgi:hypothetical protein
VLAEFRWYLRILERRLLNLRLRKRPASMAEGQQASVLMKSLLLSE